MIPINTINRDFSAAASRYEQHATLQRAWQKHTASEMISRLPAGAVLLDLGSGTGALARDLSEHNLRVIGLDAAYGMCKIAAQYQPVMQANIEQLPIKSGSVDAILCSFTLQWVNEPERVWHECARVLKPNGQLWMATFGEQTLIELKQAFTTIGRAAPVNDFISFEQLQADAKTAGFDITCAKSETHYLHYENVKALARSIKGMGAGYKEVVSSPHLTRQIWQELEKAYPKNNTNDSGISASWQVIEVVCIL